MQANQQRDLGVDEVARRARAAALALAALSTEEKNRALAAVKTVFERRREEILAANAADQEEAAKAVEAGELSASLLRRLDLQGAKFDGVLEGLDDVLKLPDPVGQVSLATRLDEGLDLYRVSCPLGVIGIIFEARPEAAVQIASLCMKSSNAVILKGGREAAQSNAVIVDAFREALAEIESFPVDAVQLLATREEVRDLLDQDEWVDLIIPRGSNELVRSIQENTRIPVLGHADGICAVYVDAAADVEKAVTVVVDSKAQYPSVCNATETLLVHADAVESVFPAVVRGLKEAGVELRCDERSSAVANAEGANWKAAIDEDYSTEFLELILAVKVVDSLDEAIEHINAHSSHHTEAIVTEDVSAAEEFMSRIDSAGVYHNASTRFADGFRYGFGAEVGVSTNKTHARGPVGLDGLVIYKYRMYGRGQGVSGYGAGKKPFLHDDLPKQLPS